MITIAMATVIDADQRRVWRALTEPGELVAWDTHLLGAVEEVDRYPDQGVSMRWRYRLGSVQVVLHDRVLEVRQPHQLRRSLRVGSLAYDQTYQLKSDPTVPARTHLSIHLTSENSIAIIGETVDRFTIRQLASEYVDETLRSVRSWCEIEV